MRESLQQFPQEEQDRRVKEGHRIALKIGPEKRGKLSKRLSSASRRPSPRKSSVERYDLSSPYCIALMISAARRRSFSLSSRSFKPRPRLMVASDDINLAISASLFSSS